MELSPGLVNFLSLLGASPALQRAGGQTAVCTAGVSNCASSLKTSSPRARCTCLLEWASQ